MTPSPTDPVREMLRAVLIGCASLHGDDSADRAVRVIVLCQDGRKLIDMLIPKGLSGEHKALVVEAPAHLPGWSFTDWFAMFDGKPVAVGSSRLKLLRVLVEATGPMSGKDLAKAVFGEHGDEESARHHVRELRKELKAAFDFDDDPVPNEGTGYRLRAALR